MVGIVIVSHSAKLAAGVRELASQMANQQVSIACAAGCLDPENPLGTDVMQVQRAIASVYSDSGVVVLMDLGSAVLSAEMALEFFPAEQRQKIFLSAAPLVEGAIAAVAQAAAGADIEQAIAEAEGALRSKTSQLSAIIPTVESVSPVQEEKAGQQSLDVTIKNQLGIHARPAAKIVAAASRFKSVEITLRNLTSNGKMASAKSVNEIITLGARQGDRLAIAAEGKDASEAIAALERLIVEDQFGEAGVDRPYSSESGRRSIVYDSQARLIGMPASPGMAIGPVVLYKPNIPEVLDAEVEDAQAEWEKLRQGMRTAQNQIMRLATDTDIFQAHILYLDDPALLARAQEQLFDRGRPAAVGWKAAIDEMVAEYQRLADPFLRARGEDLKDIGVRVLRLLIPASEISFHFPQPGIIVTDDLTPSEVLELKKTQKLLGICTCGGSALGHSAIVSNMFGIPMIVGMTRELLSLTAGTEVAVDAFTGELWVEPENIEQLRVKYLENQVVQVHQSGARTADGKSIPLMANIIEVSGASLALDCGAEGVGLLRTELLFMDRTTAPTEAEQLQAYQAIASVMGKRPLTIRTVDIGGDKSIPYMKKPVEANPFLGWRGIRQSLDCPTMFKTQLRAILRASHGHNIKLMFPMVTSLAEVRAAKKILVDVQVSLRGLGLSFDPQMQVGIMIEVPAAVSIADQLAAEVDFFSIGTNDLSQYTMAADRTNPKVTDMVDALAPAVLRMIQQTVTAAHQAGIPVTVCGQLASDIMAIPILVGLGVSQLSLNPQAIGPAVEAISQLRMDRAEAIARHVLQLDSASAVREYVAATVGS